MKSHIGALAIVGLVSLGSSAHATSFLYSGAVENYTVATSGYYAFTVAGAQGGIDSGLGIGGGGAIISGDIYFSAGTNLSILVGGGGWNGEDTAGGGGGMSFIVAGLSPVIVAGGGGGANWRVGSVGGDADAGGISGDGQGGSGQGSGAGWYSDGNQGVTDAAAYYSGGNGHSNPTFAGGDPNPTHVPIGPKGQIVLVEPGGPGGFGGGGGGGYNTGGGGGGYSGGAPSGGGTSYIDPAAFDVSAISGGNKSQGGFCFANGFCVSAGAIGYVDLNYLGDISAVPEPTTWAMFMLGFGAIGWGLRRRSLRPALHV